MSKGGAIKAYAAPAWTAVRQGDVVLVRAEGLGPDKVAAARCGSAGAARAVVVLFGMLNVGETPQARLAAARQQVEAARHAARIRLHRRAG